MKVNINTTNKSGIYCIENTINNKKYIGSSKNLYYRICRHTCDLRKNRHKNPILQNSWNKYGELNFKAYIIEYCEESLLEDREEYFINLYGDFNCAKFIGRRIVYSEKSRKKLSKSRIEGFKNGTILKYQEIPVLQYDLEGNFIQEFPSIKIACNKINMSISTLKRHLNGKFKSAKGFQWRIKSINNPISIDKYDNTRKYSSVNNVPLYVKNINTNIILYFKSYKDCANYFNVSPPCINYVVTKSKTNIYLNTYKIGLVKPCEFMETPEVDNHEPSFIEI